MLGIPGTAPTRCVEYNRNVRHNLNPSRHRDRPNLLPQAVVLRHIPEQCYSAAPTIRRRKPGERMRRRDEVPPLLSARRVHVADKRRGHSGACCRGDDDCTL